MKDFSQVFNMRYDNVPCWYELSWDSEKTEIILRIHQDVIAQDDKIEKYMPMIKSIGREIVNPYFETDLHKDFGFGGFCKDIRNNGVIDGFLEIIFRVPEYTQKVCLFCDETSECEFHKKENIFSFRRAYDISGSFVAICRFLDFCVIKTSCEKYQLLATHPIVQRSMHGGSMSCTLSKRVVDWLDNRHSDSDIDKVIEAMKQAYEMMFGPEEYMNIFYARVQENGRLILQCPGDACDLAPECYTRESCGYKLHPHNIDTPFQQITFFAGLAALHDMMREDGI